MNRFFTTGLLITLLTCSVFPSNCRCSKGIKSESTQNNEENSFFQRGMPLEDSTSIPYDGQYAPSYSAPASIRVDSPWDLNVNLSFIYWHFSQEGMDISYIAPEITPALIEGSVAATEFSYKPGFKIGMGMNTHFDDWALNLEYTWFHNTQKTKLFSSTGFLPNNWFLFGRQALYGEVSSIWGAHLDMVDFLVSRPYYEGTNLVIVPNGGLRALSIHQGVNVTMNESIFGVDPTLSSTTYSHSWAVGPKIGLNSKWMMGKGFRLDGVMGTSLLFTRYNSITNTEVSGKNVVFSSSPKINTLRPTMDLGLGLGYGSYLFKNKFFLDVSARYDFAQYWSQNMMRNFVSNLSGANDEIGDLSLHGLTLNLRCDF